MALVHPATNSSPGTTIMETSVRMSTASTPSGGSRLAQMQARFQQKQLQEKEQKLLRLYESQQQRAFQRVTARSSAGSSSNNSVSSNTSSSSFSVGKVRHMFDERRVNGSTGWDRSYPLEPLDASLNKSRPAPLPSINKTKANRVASLDRSQNNNYNQQITKTNVKRSKSQVRGGITTEVNGSSRKQNSVDSDYNASFRRLTVEEEEHDGSYRKVNNTERFTESFRIQPEEGNLYDGYRNNRIDDYDGTYRKQNSTEALNGSIRKQELSNNRVYQRDNYEDDDDKDQPFNGNQTFTVIDDTEREDLFAKYHVRDVENNELLSTSPPPELYNDDELDDSFVFKKLPNVGGTLLLDETTTAKTSDKFKTYNATKQNKKMSPPAAAEVKKGARGMAQRQSVSPPPKAASKPAPRKTENKVTSPPAGVRRPTAATLIKQNSNPQPKTSSITNMQKPPAKKITSTHSQPQRPASSQTVKSVTKRPGLTATQDDLAECQICQRRFAVDRIEKHESICRRTSTKKRKIFDATKHRVSGTEAEQYVKRLTKQKPDMRTKSKKDDWRKKHEDFIMTIRAAKEAQAHVRAGGNLRDLPPPPPLDTSDYTQCPHCLRKFNEAAAERHIPRCATMLHNKPKPSAATGALKKR